MLKVVVLRISKSFNSPALDRRSSIVVIIDIMIWEDIKSWILVTKV
jgi:hypothetical protein